MDPISNHVALMTFRNPLKKCSKIISCLFSIIHELSLCKKKLPYIITIYKFMKKSYIWMSNAFGSIYVNITTLLINSTMSILEEIKGWTHTNVEGYKILLNIDTSLHWIIDSIADFILNTTNDQQYLCNKHY